MYKLSAAIPAEQHFGFGGRLSRRTDLRLFTFSCCYFLLFFLCYCFYFSFIFVVFSYYFVIILFNFSFVRVIFDYCLLFDFSRSLWRQLALLVGCPGLMMYLVGDSGPTIPHLQALRICVLVLKSPVPVSIIFRSF